MSESGLLSAAVMFKDLICLQLVELSESSLSAAINKIPKNELDFDPDWEVDPSEIRLMDKLGRLVNASPIS